LLAAGYASEAGGGRSRLGEFPGHAADAFNADERNRVDAKLVADQLGHEVDVDINTYTLTSVELRQAAVNRLESFVGAKQCSNGAQEIRDARNLLN
jgi:hypothetical protein